jgi:hypothetical protein
VANELRATGQAEKEKIMAEADRARQVIVAEAYSQAQKAKGEGDAQATKIYAEAFQRNPEFFSFYRSMEAYRQSLRSKSDVMVVDPSSDFFKYLKSPGRGQAAARPSEPRRADDRSARRRVRAHAGDRGNHALHCPRFWREIFRKAVEMSDGQIRFFGSRR